MSYLQPAARAEETEVPQLKRRAEVVMLCLFPVFAAGDEEEDDDDEDDGEGDNEGDLGPRLVSGSKR